MSEWHELVIQGSEKSMRAFVLGFLAGRGSPEAGCFGSDLDLDEETLGARLKALFAAGSHHAYVAPAEIAGALAKALEERGRRIDLRVERRRRIDAAAFTFGIEAYSRDVAERLRLVFGTKLPPDVRIERRSESEETHPEAHGPEPFAPLHEYVYRASGDVVGPFAAVVEIWKQARQQDFVKLEPLRLEGTTLSS